MNSNFFTPWERCMMIQLVDKMYSSHTEKGLICDTKYYDLPNGRLTQTQLHKLSSWDLVRIINLNFDIKMQQYMDGACLNSIERSFGERCGIARRLIHLMHKGWALSDILAEERRHLLEVRQAHEQAHEQAAASKNASHCQKKVRKKRTDPLNEKRIVIDYVGSS